MTVFYDKQPAVLEPIGDGSYNYRWDISEVSNPATGDDEQPLTQWQCEQVKVWGPLTANKITQAVIAELWPNDYEQKLVNEYNAAVLGLYDEDTAGKKKAAYQEFLACRAAIKEQIDSDCAKLGIK